MEEYNELKLLEKVKAGFKGGPFFSSFVGTPKHSFTKVNQEMDSALRHVPAPNLPIGNPWFKRSRGK